MQPKEPFHSDGCTLSPDFNFRDCCVDHDRAYWCGGTSADRAKADRILRDCVRAKGHPILCRVYYAAVRAFGHRFWPKRNHWGFGWSRKEYGWRAGSSTPPSR